MKPAEILREIAYPVSHLQVLVPMVTSWLLFAAALAFGLFGLFLFLVTLIPCVRYLTEVLTARAHNRESRRQRCRS